MHSHDNWYVTGRETFPFNAAGHCCITASCIANIIKAGKLHRWVSRISYSYVFQLERGKVRDSQNAETHLLHEERTFTGPIMYLKRVLQELTIWVTLTFATAGTASITTSNPCRRSCSCCRTAQLDSETELRSLYLVWDVPVRRRALVLPSSVLISVNPQVNYAWPLGTHIAAGLYNRVSPSIDLE